MSAAPLSALILSDGRRGIENQALGLARACAALRPLSVKSHTLSPKGLFKKAAPGLQFSLKSSPEDYAIKGSAPDLAIGCGRQAIAPLRALKSRYGNDVFTVYIQDPRTELSYFDLVIAPAHDGLSGRNVETMIGSPNRISAEQIIGETLVFADALNALPMPRVAVMIGGPSRSHDLSRAVHAQHLDACHTLLGQGYSLMISTSRRTPDWAIADYKRLESDHDHIWLYTDGTPNPYFAFLGGAEAILVTEESTNMLTEACAIGKPVYRLMMDGKAGKFEALYAALAQRCGVKRFDGVLDLPDYAPLTETARIAEQLWAHYDARSAVIN